MSVTKEITLWCDVNGCSEWTQAAQYETRRTVAGARKVAREVGWTWRRDRGDWCPKCSGNKPPLKAY